MQSTLMIFLSTSVTDMEVIKVNASFWLSVVIGVRAFFIAVEASTPNLFLQGLSIDTNGQDIYFPLLYAFSLVLLGLFFLLSF